MVYVGAIGQEHIGKGAPVLVLAERLEGNFPPYSNKNGGPSAGTAVCDDIRLVVYAEFFSRHAARPKRPAPSNNREEGSGTDSPVMWRAM